MYQYNYIIGHLLCEDDGVSTEDVEKYNFQIALFGGFMTHLGRKHCKFISHKNNKKEKFTDKRPEQRYSNTTEAKQNIVNLLGEIK